MARGVRCPRFVKITALVEGLTELVDQQGVSSPLPGSPNVALCRCGASSKKPFCDGSHVKAGFRSAPVVVEAAKARPSLSTWESEGGSSALPVTPAQPRSAAMKRAPVGVLLAAALCLAATDARAQQQVMVVQQNQQSGRNMLLVNPGDLFSGVISLEYERALLPWFGLTAGVSLWTFRGVFTPLGEPTYTGVGPELGARFHFIRDAPRGLWVGPSISAGYQLGRSDGAVSRLWSWGLGAGVGYNFVFFRFFTFQLGAAGGFVDYGEKLVWSPRLKLGVGATF